jgi:hypothetical protein
LADPHDDAGPAGAPRPLSRMSLRELDALIGSDAHYGQTATRHYGPHDPVQDAPRFIWPCRCGAAAALCLDFPDAAQRAAQGGGPAGPPQRAYFVHCTACGERGRSSARAWAAVVEWNRANVAVRSRLEDFGFFQLAGLTPDAAKTKLAGIRADLEARAAQNRARSRARIETGRAYAQRIEAYRGWAIVAQALLKAQRRAAAGPASAPGPIPGATPTPAGASEAPEAQAAPGRAAVP